jgi:hypothetical protein
MMHKESPLESAPGAFYLNLLAKIKLTYIVFVS